MLARLHIHFYSGLIRSNDLGAPDIDEYDDIRFYGLMLAIYILLAPPILVLTRVIGRKITLDLSSYWSALSKSTLVAFLLAPALIAYHGFLVFMFRMNPGLIMKNYPILGSLLRN